MGGIADLYRLIRISGVTT